jgi:GNAT superfamily N-acetyltransferase
VATAGDALVGFIHLCEEEDYYGGRCGHVGDVVVAPEARGKGVGRALMAAGERWARERGYRLLTLNVFLDNERARALYEELGFRPETVRHVKPLD